MKKIHKIRILDLWFRPTQQAKRIGLHGENVGLYLLTEYAES